MNAIRILKDMLTREAVLPVYRRLFNFAYWQLIGKRTSKRLQFMLPDGAKMKMSPGETGATGFYYYGYPDMEEMMFLRKYLQPNDVFVDVGANSGGWSLTSFGLGASVIAIEPVASSFQRLSENFALNNSTKLKALHLGISDAEGELFFTTNADTGNKVVDTATAGHDTERVKVTTLDILLGDINPRMIKIDVEGHELPVIHGARNTLQKKDLKALIIETFRFANYNLDSLKEIESILASNDFLPVTYKYETDQFIRLKPGEGGQNTIYVSTKYFAIT